MTAGRIHLCTSYLCFLIDCRPHCVCDCVVRGVLTEKDLRKPATSIVTALVPFDYSFQPSVLCSFFFFFGTAFLNMLHGRHHLLKSASCSYWGEEQVDTVIIQETGLFGMRGHYGMKVRISCSEGCCCGSAFFCPK